MEGDPVDTKTTQLMERVKMNHLERAKMLIQERKNMK
jgi:hypothetical protein